MNTSGNSSVNTSDGLGNICHFATDSEASKGLKITAYVIALLVSLVGNSLVMAAVLKNRQMRTVTNCLIVNMAASDLLVTLFNMPQTMYFVVTAPDSSWPGGEWGSFSCKFLPFIQSVSIASSVLSLTVIAVDRFLAIVFPFKGYMTFLVATLSMATLWFVAMVTSTPLLYAMRIREQPHQGVFCGENWGPAFDQNESPKIYTVVLFTAFYVVPLVAMLFLYGILIWRLWIRKVPGNCNLENQERADKSKKKVLTMLMTVVCAFAICWLPVYIMQFLTYFKPGVCLSSQLYFIGYFFGHLNSAINPCIYAIFNEKFRRGFVDVLKPVMFCGRGVKVHPSSGGMGADVTYTDEARPPGRASGKSSCPAPSVHPALRRSYEL